MPTDCTLVIFGSTGNLSQIKLLPALYHLELAGHLPPSMRVLGFGRRDWSDQHWRDEVRGWVEQSARGGLDEAALERLLDRLYFVAGDL
ncbi:MAG: glucose-6-phosphate dehydrogenase, partial [Halochromatium sp.]